MPLKTNIGVSRKIADNSYGSRGASVNLEVELDSTLINDPERFHDRIRQVFRLAQQAIDEELTRQQRVGTTSNATNGASNGMLPSRRRMATAMLNLRMAMATARPRIWSRDKATLLRPSNSPSGSMVSVSAAWKTSPRRCSASPLWG